MTEPERNQLKKLYKLIGLADEFPDTINLKLVDHWCTIREEHGLLKTLNLITEYAQTQTNFTPIPPQTTNTNQDPDVVQ